MVDGDDRAGSRLARRSGRARRGRHRHRPAFCAGADLKQRGAPRQPGEMDFLDAIVVFFDTLRGFPSP
jgi:enoyl-CoA hydratase/carnithine racemase